MSQLKTKLEAALRQEKDGMERLKGSIIALEYMLNLVTEEEVAAAAAEAAKERSVDRVAPAVAEPADHQAAGPRVEDAADAAYDPDDLLHP